MLFLSDPLPARSQQIQPYVVRVPREAIAQRRQFANLILIDRSCHDLAERVRWEGEPVDGLQRLRQIVALLNQAYYLMSAGQLDMAERILLLLQKQLTAQDLPAYRFSTQIGLGLLALARQQFERADSLLREALARKQNIYIEVYVLAEIGLARIAQCRGHYAEAYTRLQNMLAFSGERSLLELYVNCALSLGRLSLCMQQVQGVAGLLEDAHRLIAAAGSPWLARECRELLAQLA
jgi:tetratricopeptide (TPR) repeat protein